MTSKSAPAARNIAWRDELPEPKINRGQLPGSGTVEAIAARSVATIGKCSEGTVSCPSVIRRTTSSRLATPKAGKEQKFPSSRETP
eukprot:CAMPEP_0172715090 /NCGR_PEP_ID=MMETSP1074-20121228/67347_1 /TAXON_ID=2916 /ORGANISM="Ceratium fusus, Strain PA161109" /LENGTH=85 /DNA_ID=CAMNT_0013539629 /DNA_START=487 /DNA_END=744 /DNA_ORIENTATION=+